VSYGFFARDHIKQSLTSEANVGLGELPVIVKLYQL